MVSGLGELEGSVASRQRAGGDLPGTRPAAVGTGPSLLGRGGLLGGGLQADLAGDRLTDRVGHLLDVPKRGVRGGGLGPAERLPHEADEFLEPWVLGILAEAGAGHG
jgi:hypothetical protein